jgi:hypothetical protein
VVREIVRVVTLIQIPILDAGRRRVFMLPRFRSIVPSPDPLRVFGVGIGDRRRECGRLP